MADANGQQPNLFKDVVENVGTARERAQIMHERVHEAGEGCHLGGSNGTRREETVPL